MATSIYAGQPYTIKLDVGNQVDLTLATSKKIRYRKPDGTVAYIDATVEGSGNRILSAAVTSTINNATGSWEFRAWLVFPGDAGVVPGKPFMLDVEGL